MKLKLLLESAISYLIESTKSVIILSFFTYSFSFFSSWISKSPMLAIELAEFLPLPVDISYKKSLIIFYFFLPCSIFSANSQNSFLIPSTISLPLVMISYFWNHSLRETWRSWFFFFLIFLFVRLFSQASNLNWNLLFSGPIFF